MLVGGLTCPASLLRRVDERFGARVQTSWGMTELSPMGTIAFPNGPNGAPGSSGPPPMGQDLKLPDPDGKMLPDQRGSVGHLKVRGPSVIDSYFKRPEDVLDEDGFFDTGDLAMLDADGNLTICGRSKDLIKSGGEWINPAEMEAIVGRDPTVGAVAVIGRADAKWGERPVLVVQPRQNQAVDPAALIAGLRGKVADWWLPTEVAELEKMPLAATGKIDKRRLREDFEAGAIEARPIASR